MTFHYLLKSGIANFADETIITGGETMKGSTTSWTVLATGAAVTGLGRVIGGTLGAGITGFGLAHIALGVLDQFRPSVKY